MASVKLCPKCGGTLVAVGERTGGFSGKKAVVGAVVAGPVGVAAGALGKQLVTLKCEKCGYTVETDAKSAEAAEQYGSTHEIMENLQRSIANMQSAGKATAWSFDTCRNVFNESLTTQRLQHTTIATDGVIYAAVHNDGTVAFAFSSEHPDNYKHEASEYSEVKEWKNIISIAVANGCIFGVREDGKVEVSGAAPGIEAAVKSWSDIVMIAAHNVPIPDAPVLGLRSNGTVVVAGRNIGGMCDVSGWKDIVMIACSSSADSDGYTVGLRTDGTVTTAGNYSCDQSGSNVNNWTNVINIYASMHALVGVQANGSICSTKGLFASSLLKATENGKGAVAVFGTSVYQYILTLDGTLHGRNDRIFDLNDGKEIVAGVGDSLKYDEILLLLKKDGTVTLKDYREKHQALKAEVEAWTDIRVLPVCRERVETFAEMCKMEEEENFKKQKEAEEHAKQWKASGRCQHCGGAFSMFGKKCKNCGKPKDY